MNRISLWLGCTALVAGAVSLPGFAQQQVTVVGGSATCTGSPNLTVDPSGNLNFSNCTLNSSNPNLPPTCSLPVAIAATTGVQTTITASCSPAPTTFTWAGTVAPTGGFPNAASFPITFATAGTYQYAVQGTNANGVGNTASTTVTVSDPGQGGNCATFPAAALNVTWAGTGAQNTNVNFAGAGYAAFKLPLFTAGLGFRAFSAVNNSTPGVTTGGTLRAQFSVSTCPGDFTTNPANCRTTGTPENAAIQLLFKNSATPTSYCTLTPGTQYYLNVQNLNCASTNCGEIVKLN